MATLVRILKDQWLVTKSSITPYFPRILIMFTRILTAAALLAGFASVIDVALAQDEYQSALLEHHNIHRSNHSAPDVTWDSNLANIANEIGMSLNVCPTCLC